ALECTFFHCCLNSRGRRNAQMSVKTLWRIGSVLAVAILEIAAVASIGHAAAGDLDTSFHGDGIRQVSLSSDLETDCCQGTWATLLQPDGKIVVAGQYAGDPSSFPLGGASILFRLKRDGTFDHTFGDKGRTLVDLGDPGRLDFSPVFDAALDSSGRIVTVGVYRQGFFVARYTPHGQLDSTFNDDGMVFTNFGGREGASGVVVQPDGKVVAVGFARGHQDFDYRLAVVRYTARGRRDPTFDGDGKEIVDVPAAFGRSESVAEIGRASCRERG